MVGAFAIRSITTRGCVEGEELFGVMGDWTFVALVGGSAAGDKFQGMLWRQLVVDGDAFGRPGGGKRFTGSGSGGGGGASVYTTGFLQEASRPHLSRFGLRFGLRPSRPASDARFVIGGRGAALLVAEIGSRTRVLRKGLNSIAIASTAGSVIFLGLEVFPCLEATGYSQQRDSRAMRLSS
jgi:hypothetical protein